MCVLINTPFPLKCQEHRLIYISINLLSAAMTVLLGEADKHQCVGTGLGPNINTLLRTAAESKGAGTGSKPVCACARRDPHTAAVGTSHRCMYLEAVDTGGGKRKSPPSPHLVLCWGLALAALTEDKALGCARGLLWPFHSFSDGQGTLHKLPTNFLQANQRP